MSSSGNTTQLQSLVEQAAGGDDGAYERLLEHSFQRLHKMTKRMLRDYPRLRRWEQTDDVFQNAAMKLYRSLEEVRPDSARGFLALAATQIRRTLIDLVRHYYGPQGLGAKHFSDGDGKAADDGVLRELADDGSGPRSLVQWAEFHEAVEQLPREPREVFELVWYGGLQQKEVAQLLEVSVATVQRRWYQAQHLMFQATGGKSPLDDEHG